MHFYGGVTAYIVPFITRKGDYATWIITPWVDLVGLPCVNPFSPGLPQPVEFVQPGGRGIYLQQLLASPAGSCSQVTVYCHIQAVLLCVRGSILSQGCPYLPWIDAT
jgi:hypothetical protein